VVGVHPIFFVELLVKVSNSSPHRYGEQAQTHLTKSPAHGRLTATGFAEKSATARVPDGHEFVQVGADFVVGKTGGHAMSILEASQLCGLSAYTLKAEARKGSFVADMPRGRMGGYVIDRESFELWLIRRKLKTGNSPARALARRQLEQLGAL
jgi:hypothetical protein